MSWKCINCDWTNSDKWDRCAQCGLPKAKTQEDLRKIKERHEFLKNFMLSTTSNYDVEKTFGIVNSNVVLGTGIFGDLSASFSDLMGYSATGYQKKLDEATRSSFNQIIAKATEKYPECNALIGVHIDYSSLSGNMLMVCTYGTAVFINDLT